MSRVWEDLPPHGILQGPSGSPRGGWISHLRDLPRGIHISGRCCCWWGSYWRLQTWALCLLFKIFFFFFPFDFTPYINMEKRTHGMQNIYKSAHTIRFLYRRWTELQSVWLPVFLHKYCHSLLLIGNCREEDIQSVKMFFLPSTGPAGATLWIPQWEHWPAWEPQEAKSGMSGVPGRVLQPCHADSPHEGSQEGKPVYFLQHFYFSCL